MENNIWQINENLYKVHLSADVFEELKKEFNEIEYCWKNGRGAYESPNFSKII